MNFNQSKKYLREFSNYVVMEPYPFVMDIRKSKGMWIATVDGDMIFDWAGYYGSKLIGHNHPMMFEKEYIDRLIYAANNKTANPDFLTPECVEYYRKLYEYAPECMKNPNLEIYAVNSGAEAVENLAKYFINLYDAKRKLKGLHLGTRRLIYCEQAFHGRTIFALNITRLPHAPVVTRDFEGMVLGNIQVPFPAIDPLKSESENRKYTKECLLHIDGILGQYTDEIVGIIVEPIQGAGGHRIAYPDFFRELSKITHDHGVFLGFDEVQTAGGQTGNFFMADSFQLPYPPQGIASGKKLGNGVVYMFNSMKDLGVLDSTWGGTLADMVRFVQEMKVVEKEKLLEQVASKAEVLVEGLLALEKKHANKIYNIRGMGLYQGFSLRETHHVSSLLENALLKENLLLLDAGTDSIRFRPVLDVTVDDINLMLQKLDRVLLSI